MERPPLKENVANARPSRLMKPGSFLPKPASQLPKPASVSVGAVKRKADSPPEEVKVTTGAATKRQKITPPAAASKVSAPATKNSIPARPPAVNRAPAARGAVAARPGVAKPAPRTGSSYGQNKARPVAGRAPVATRPGGVSTGRAPGRPGAVAKPPAKPKPEVLVKQLEAQTKELEEENTDLKERLEALQYELETAQSAVQTLQRDLTAAEETLLDTEREYKAELRKEREANEELKHSSRQLKRKVERQEEDIKDKQETIAGLKDTVASQKDKISDLQDTIQEKTTRIDELKQRVEEQKEAIADLRSTVADRNTTISELEATIRAREETIKELESKIREDERVRRMLHNTIQELKGNIRVFCRVRPLLPDETTGALSDDDIPHITFSKDGKSLELEKLSDIGVNESIASQSGRGSGKGKYHFSFDEVFNPGCSQSHVFEEISQLVQSALDGYHVAIFAYGQTGSGKTYTMEGPNNPTQEDWGMIPRAVEQVFDSSQQMAEQGWKYELQVSFLEIYNEKIRDLLGNPKEDTKHELKMVSANSSEVTVTNLTTITVSTPAQVYKLLKKASENRAVAETKANERSSRSHSVFRLHIQGHNTHTEEKCAGYLNMIDLAGSERLKESKSEGERLRETKNINSSLANLGNVIMALANKDSHIPYRNSKLTHLLSNCLGGSSKVLMFLNISPREECFAESLNSLRFATKVNNCHIGTAQKKSK